MKTRARARVPAPRAAAALSHVGRSGDPRMVDVSAKAVTSREAVARGEIAMSAEALAQIRSGAVAKGDPLQTARWRSRRQPRRLHRPESRWKR